MVSERVGLEGLSSTLEYLDYVYGGDGLYKIYRLSTECGEL